MPIKFSKAMLLVCLLTLPALAQTPQFISFAAAKPVLDAMPNSLPSALKGQLNAATWDKWVHASDKETRSRIDEGEENTLTNLLRMGVTFTKEDPITYEDLDRYGQSNAIDTIADKRASDLVKALAAPHPSEGMLEMRALLERKGFTLKTPEGQQKVKAYLLANLARWRDDVARARAEAKANPYQAFKDRGISTDSNLYPDYTIQLHLKHMMDQGMLKPGSIHRIAIVGPGLDFVNKKSGSDFVPPQTTQPFAVIDSLARLGLADPATIEVYTFDISPRVNHHLERARKDATCRQGLHHSTAIEPVRSMEPGLPQRLHRILAEAGRQDRQAGRAHSCSRGRRRHLEPRCDGAPWRRAEGHPHRHERCVSDFGIASRQTV